MNIVDLRYNDSFNNIPVVNTEGKETTLKYGENNTILFYLSSSCTGCNDVLNFLERLQIIYFCMSGCPDCAAADDILSKDKEKRSLYYLYKYDDVNPSHPKDDYALFRLIYGIKWYSSFLVLQSQEEYTIVGEVPIETLISELDGYK